MQKTFDNPAGAPVPAGRYSHVARIDLGSGALLVLSGQVAVDDEGAIIGHGDMAAQTERIFEIIAGLLAAHGASFDDVVNIRTYLTDIGQLKEYAQVRRRYVTGEPPTSTTVEVSRLFRPEALVEVEVVAAVGA